MWIYIIKRTIIHRTIYIDQFRNILSLRGDLYNNRFVNIIIIILVFTYFMHIRQCNPGVFTGRTPRFYHCGLGTNLFVNYFIVVVSQQRQINNSVNCTGLFYISRTSAVIFSFYISIEIIMYKNVQNNITVIIFCIS